MTSRLWVRVLLQFATAGVLFALALPVLASVDRALDAVFHYPDLHDATREPGHVTLFAVLYALLSAAAAALTGRLTRRPWEALGGVGLFAVLGAWAAWQSQVETRAITGLQPSLLFPAALALGSLTGCVAGAAVFRRRRPAHGREGRQDVSIDG